MTNPASLPAPLGGDTSKPVAATAQIRGRVLIEWWLSGREIRY